MSTFDPYLQWLGIRDAIRPPNHYRLLGLEPFESDANVIATAADRQMAHVRTFQSGKHAAVSQRLLNELSAARLCLLKPERKQEYDRALRQQVTKVAAPKAAHSAPKPAFAATAEATAAALPDFAGPSTYVRPKRPKRKRRATGAYAVASVLLLALGIVGFAVVRNSGNSPRLAARSVAQNEKPQPAAIEPQPRAAAAPAKFTEPAPAQAADRPAPQTNPAEPASDSENTQSPDSEEREPAADANQPATDDGPTPEQDQPAQAASDASGNDTRTPVPSDAALHAADQKARQVFREEWDGARTAEKQAALAKILLSQARDSDADRSSQFALFGQAEELAIRAGDVSLALDCADGLASRFAVDALKAKADLLTRLGKQVRGAGAAEKLLEQVGSTIQEASQRERLDLAGSLAKQAVALAMKSKNTEAKKEAIAREKEIKERERGYEQAQQARTRLQTEPDDAAANAQLGKYLCFTRNDWALGVPFLAKGNDARLSGIARQELAGPAEAESQVALADLWWEAVPGSAGLKVACRARAAYWYEKALPQLKGLERRRVEKQLASLDTAGEPRGKAGPAGVSLTINLGKDAKLSFRRIPAGKFVMGGPETASVGGGPHPVTISKPFFLGTTEVTQAQFQAITGANPSFQKGDPNLPVENVTWSECQAFCQQLQQSQKKYRFRLPTEAEWEYACRAQTQTAYYFGNDPAPLAQHSWNNDTTGREGKTHPVAQLLANPWGLHDMLGNVAEWCSDFYQAATPDSGVDPQGPPVGNQRVVRGGGMVQDRFSARSGQRGGLQPETRYHYVGFRVVAEPR